MNIAYGIAGMVLLLGLGLLTLGASAPQEQITFLGVTFQSHLARGMGIVSVIFSFVTFLVAYGSSLPPHSTHPRHK